MYSMPVRTVWTFFTSPLMQCPEYMLPRVESSQPGTNIGRFFEVRAGATDGVDLSLTNHFRERQTDLGGRHRAGESHQHRAAAIEMPDVVIGGRSQRRGVEMTIMSPYEVDDRTAHRARMIAQ